jgi:hypothetical protein
VLPANIQVIHHGDTTEYIIPVSDEEYRINILYLLLPVLAAVLLLTWRRGRKKKRP